MAVGNLRWSPEPTVVMWFIERSGTLCRHDFYHVPRSPRAIAHAQHWEYERGYVTWLEYRTEAAYGG